MTDRWSNVREKGNPASLWYNELAFDSCIPFGRWMGDGREPGSLLDQSTGMMQGRYFVIE